MHHRLAATKLLNMSNCMLITKSDVQQVVLSLPDKPIKNTQKTNKKQCEVVLVRGSPNLSFLKCHKEKSHL